MRTRRLALLLLVAGLALVAAEDPLAQTTSSSVVGTVRTKDGETVPGAVVEVSSAETGIVRSVLTDRDGAYRINLLAPGQWKIEARFSDGQASESLQVTLRLQQVLHLDLKLGSAITESVTVTGTAPIVDPQRTGGELRLEGAQTEVIPVSGRLVTDLALLDSSVRPTPPGNFYGERGTVFIVNGQSGRANAFLVDGLDNNDQTSGTSPNAFFSQQVVRELVVNTHQYAPEFGRATGAVFNIVTERGENETLSDVFVQGTRQAWNDPGSFVESLPVQSGQQTSVQRYQAGFRIGGPLVKNRSFYFLAYEHQEASDVFPYTGVTADGVHGGVVSGPGSDDNLFFRTDFNLTPAHALMVRLSADDRTTSMLNVGGITTPERGSRVEEKDYQLAASLTSILSPDLLNEARLLVGSSSFDQYGNSTLSGVERPSGAFGGGNLNQQYRDEDRVEILDNLTLRHGAHTLKFGLGVTRSTTRIDTLFNPNGNFTYDTDRPFEPGDGYVRGSNDCYYAGLPPDPCVGVPGLDDDGDGLVDEPPDPDTYAVVYQLIFGQPHAEFPDTEYAFFAQDGWQVGPRLLLDYGLRYDLSTFHLPMDARVDSTVPNGGAGVDKNNVAPRFGFTYAPTPGGRLLIRGGAGMFYGKMVLGFPAVAAVTSQTKIGLTFPEGFGFEFTEKLIEEEGIDAVLPDVVFPEELIMQFSTGTELDTPYTNQFNLGLECAVGSHGAVFANAMRAFGYHQPLFLDLNPPVGTRPPGIPNHVADPNVGSIAAIVTEGRIWYSGLDLGWRYKSERAWWAATYTLSKAIDEGPDPLTGGVYIPPDSGDLASEKGRADADRRHRLVLSGDFPLPWMGLRASGVIQIASGTPFNVTTGQDNNLDGMTTDRPAGVGRNTGAKTPLGPVNDLRAEAGLPPVYSLSEPTLAQVDLRVSRPFFLNNRKTGSEFFVQVFNLLNRFNGGPVEGRVTSTDFGRPVGQAGPPRIFEMGLKLGF